MMNRAPSFMIFSLDCHVPVESLNRSRLLYSFDPDLCAGLLKGSEIRASPTKTLTNEPKLHRMHGTKLNKALES